MSTQFKIICATCKADAQVTSGCDGEAAICPTCGQRDDLEDAQRIAGEHFLQEMIPGLQTDLESLIKGDKFMKSEGERQTRHSCRWHAVPL